MPVKAERLERRVPPFRGLPEGERVMLALSIAAGEMGSRIESILRTREPVLSHMRYNALRILRGEGEAGLSCTAIGSRLLVSPPDVTRLMDPLASRGLVSRAPDPEDRRVVIQRLTPRGESLLSALDDDLAVVYEAISAGLDERLVARLLDACERFIGVAEGLDVQREPASGER